MHLTIDVKGSILQMIVKYFNGLLPVKKCISSDNLSSP